MNPCKDLGKKNVVLSRLTATVHIYIFFTSKETFWIDLISPESWNLLNTCNSMSAISYSINLKQVYRPSQRTDKLFKGIFRAQREHTVWITHKNVHKCKGVSKQTLRRFNYSNSNWQDKEKQLKELRADAPRWVYPWRCFQGWRHCSSPSPTAEAGSSRW